MTETEEKHDAPALVEGRSAGKTTGCMYSRKYTTSRPTCSATVYDYVNSEDRAITTASSSSYALKTSCYPEQPYGGEHYLEGRHGTVVRSKVADSDNFKATVTSRSNTGEVYCTGADVDRIKVTDTDTTKDMASTSAYSVKDYDYTTVARAKSNTWSSVRWLKRQE